MRDRNAAIAAFVAGKGLLVTQTIDILEMIVSGDRVAVRATWQGTTAHATDALPSGTKLVAQLAAWVTVTNGLITEHETFDCYEPLTRAP